MNCYFLRARSLLSLCLLLFIIFAFFSVPVSATTSYEEWNTIMGDDMVGDANPEEVNEYIADKGSGIVSIMQNAAVWILIIVFIGFALMSLIGLFGKGSHVFTGLLGMLGCGIILFCVLYAPEINVYIAKYFVPDGTPFKM